jgi:hypothetical protein
MAVEMEWFLWRPDEYGRGGKTGGCATAWQACGDEEKRVIDQNPSFLGLMGGNGSASLPPQHGNFFPPSA